MRACRHYGVVEGLVLRLKQGSAWWGGERKGASKNGSVTGPGHSAAGSWHTAAPGARWGVPI